MPTRRCERERGRGRIGNVMPEASGNNPNHVDFMATLGNMAAMMQVHPLAFRGTSNPTDADNWIQAIERALQAQ
ncbi:hypothetical protein AHAS_Ahas05G0060100 [Arachis hypogaea]